jgi:pyruvate kinase
VPFKYFAPSPITQVFHMERSANSLLNLQNNLPLFSEYDRQAIAALGREFEVDYVNLAYTRTR